MSVSPLVQSSSSGSRSALRAAGVEEEDPKDVDAEDNEKKEAEDISEEVHKVRRTPTPILPTTDEVDEHNLLGCVQCRSWCSHCVSSRG